jgi:hypothetical protein
MGMLGATRITDGNDNAVATGRDGNDDDATAPGNPLLMVMVDQDNGLQVGAVYKITMSDNTGWQGITYMGNDGTQWEFSLQNANKF